MVAVMTYDSTADTLKHIRRVQQLLGLAAGELIRRGTCHDDSKLQSPEKEAFDIATPKLKDLVYGSSEYKAAMAEMRPAIEHHSANNSHHPEHYENGLNGFDLFDLMEMFFDWKAAGERHADGGSIQRSIEINKDRFEMSDQLCNILLNTAERQGWIN